MGAVKKSVKKDVIDLMKHLSDLIHNQ